MNPRINYDLLARAEGNSMDRAIRAGMTAGCRQTPIRQLAETDPSLYQPFVKKCTQKAKSSR